MLTSVGRSGIEILHWPEFPVTITIQMASHYFASTQILDFLDDVTKMRHFNTNALRGTFKKR